MHYKIKKMVLEEHLIESRELSWEKFGKRFIAFLPGMFTCDGIKGAYPAISMTGKRCELLCDHCKGRLLRTMLAARTPSKLVDMAIRMEEKGCHGILVTGGCDREARLPWDRFLPAVKEIKEKTNLLVSIHSGIIEPFMAKEFKDAGIDQALIDVIGDDETYREICHVNFGIDRIFDTIRHMREEGIKVVPHVVCGIRHGSIGSEARALEMLAGLGVEQLVIVSLMPLPGTPMWGRPAPKAEDIAEIIAKARLMMPNVLMSLGCARQRGDVELEKMAIDAGITRMAIPSEEAIEHARNYGLEIRYQKTCCSVLHDFSGDRW